MEHIPRQSNSNDLCALAEVKEYVFRGGGNATLDDDNLLQRLITAASEWICQETSRRYTPGNYTETRSGTGGRILFFRNPPVSSVSSLYINGNAIPARNTVVTAYGQIGYTFSAYRLSLTGYLFDRGMDNIQITYQMGNNTVFPDIEQACIEAVSWAFRELDRLGQRSKTLAGETVEFDMGALSDRSRKTLQRYRSPIPTV